MKKIKAILSILLIYIILTDVILVNADLHFTPYKQYDGVTYEKYGGRKTEESSSDGGSDSDSAGTIVSKEEEKTHGSQQDIRKDFKDIIAKIKKTDFVNLFNNGQTSIYGGKGKLTEKEMKNIFKNLDIYQKNRTKGSFGEAYNLNDYPRTMKDMPVANLSTKKKKQAQELIVKRENVKTNKKDSDSSSNLSGITVDKDSGKISLNSPFVTNEFDPPGVKSNTYIKDLIKNGVRDFDNWDSRYETLRNYFNKKNSIENLTGTGANSSQTNAYTFLGRLSQINSFIKAHHNSFERGWDNGMSSFALAQNRVAHGSKVNITCVVPTSWALGDVGVRADNGKWYLAHGVNGSFETFNGNMPDYLYKLESGGPVGMTFKEAIQKHMLCPGDIISKSDSEHTCTFSGFGGYFYGGGGECGDYSNGVCLDYSKGYYADKKIGHVLRWKEFGKDGKGPSGDGQNGPVYLNKVFYLPNSILSYPIPDVSDAGGLAGTSLLDFDDVAYVESYFLTSENKAYYKITDYRSDIRHYKLFGPNGNEIRSDKTTDKELNFNDIKEPGTYTLKWWQWCEVTTGISVNYLKRQYLILLPSNTILYYKESFVDNDPVIVNEKKEWRWVLVNEEKQTIKDANGIETGGTVIERTQ